MQTIFKTPCNINFSILDNDIVNDAVLTIKAKAVLIYLLSKPHDWQLRIGDIKKKLHIGTHSVRSALKNLMQSGYVFYRRLASGHTVWTIYDKPQHIDIQPQTDKPQQGSKHVLVNTDKTLSIEIQQPDIIEQSVETVVVSQNEGQSDIIKQSKLIDIVYPDQLDAKQRKTAKHILKTRLKEQKMAQEILFSLAYAMTNTQINSIPAYLNGLINAANAGTFTAPNSAQSKPITGGTPLIPVWVAPKSNPTQKDVAKGFIGGLRDALRGV